MRYNFALDIFKCLNFLVFSNILYFFELSESWGGATSISDHLWWYFFVDLSNRTFREAPSKVFNSVGWRLCCGEGREVGRVINIPSHKCVKSANSTDNLAPPPSSERKEGWDADSRYHPSSDTTSTHLINFANYKSRNRQLAFKSQIILLQDNFWSSFGAWKYII